MQAFKSICLIVLVAVPSVVARLGDIPIPVCSDIQCGELVCSSPGKPVMQVGVCCPICEFGGEVPGTIDPSQEEIGEWYNTRPKIGGNPMCQAVWCPNPQCVDEEDKYVPVDACCYQCGGGTRVHGGAADVAHHTVEEREAHHEAAGEYGYDAMSHTMENDPYEGTHREMSA